MEREARSHLRPLKRQAEAAELHERLERQSLEARLELARDKAKAAGDRLAEAESEAAAARSLRGDAEGRLEAVQSKREAAERAMAEHGRAREALSARLFAATTSADRVEMRLERVRELGAGAADAARRGRDELRRLGGGEEPDAESDATEADGDDPSAGETGDPEGTGPMDRVRRLEAELAALDEARPESSDRELEQLRERRDHCERRRVAHEGEVSERRAAGQAAEAEVAPLRSARRAAEAELETARSERAAARAELDAVVQLARTAAAAPGKVGALAEHLRVEPGYELALAAALGPLVRAGLAAGITEASSLLDDYEGGAGTVVVQGSEAGSASDATGATRRRRVPRRSPCWTGSPRARRQAPRRKGSSGTPGSSTRCRMFATTSGESP